jgi:hypothetical protein
MNSTLWKENSVAYIASGCSSSLLYSVFCRLEPIQEANRNTVLRFQIAASNLDVGRKVRGLFSGAPNTIFQIAKRHPNCSQLAWIAVYRSSPVQESIDPTWDVGEMDLESCCNGDLVSSPFVTCCHDF